MRTREPFVYRYILFPTLVSMLAFACADDAPSEPAAESGGSGNSGRGGSSRGGASGASTTGGDASGGDGAAGEAGSTSSGGGGASGGTQSGGTTSTGGDAGSATGGSAGSAGSGGSGGGTPSTGCKADGSPMSGRFPIDVDGTMRDYIVKLPDDYDPEHPYRLIFTFHGGMYSAQTVADGGPPGSGPYYGIEAVAGGTAIFVAPQALSGSWTNQGGRDVAYVNAMVARFKEELCVDESRVFATGFSMGAIMTLTLGCENDGTFRAIAPMSGRLPESCDTESELAYWSSHGTGDMTIRIAEGEAARDKFRVNNSCSATTVPGDREGCVSYENCEASAPVTFCTFEGAHVPAPYAGEAIWDFFEQF